MVRNWDPNLGKRIETQRPISSCSSRRRFPKLSESKFGSKVEIYEVCRNDSWFGDARNKAVRANPCRILEFRDSSGSLPGEDVVKDDVSRMNCIQLLRTNRRSFEGRFMKAAFAEGADSKFVVQLAHLGFYRPTDQWCDFSHGASLDPINNLLKG